MKSSLLVSLIFLIFLSFSCNSGVKKEETLIDSTIAQGDLRIIYSGALTIPVQQIVRQFEKEYPYVKVDAEALGSRIAARKIADFDNPCDVFITSDYRVIKNLLIPRHANWYIEFGTDELVLAYQQESHLKSKINKDNWYKILMDDSVRYGRANPDDNTCGNRMVISIKLAEKYYQELGIKDNLLFKDKEFIEPSIQDLVQLLRKKKIDYAFIYKSVALAEELPYIELPPQINLGSDKFASYYSQASTRVSSNKPGKYVTLKGEPIRYAITRINNTANPVAADAFLGYFINKSKGLAILKKENLKVLDSLTIIPTDSSTLEVREQFGL